MTDSADAVAVTRSGHRTFFKWHRGRRYAADPVFLGSRIVEGMRLGASVEVDLLVHHGDGFAVLHDLVLDAETTGSGPVREHSAAELRSLFIRDNDGAPTSERVMLLDDLVALLLASGMHSGALLQLDYKEDQPSLGGEAIENFATAIAPLSRHLILSSPDVEAVRRLSAAVPGIRIGYDPCYGEALARLEATKDFRAFLADSLSAIPGAEVIYLAYPLLLEAADHGFDIVAAYHEKNRRVDAYTVETVDKQSIVLVERLLALCVDQITTDDPQGLAAALVQNL